MLKWLTMLWVVICVVCFPFGAASQEIGEKTKQTSTIKKIESLTVQRLLPGAVRIQEQSTFEKRKNIAAKVERMIRKSGVTSDKAVIAVLANAWHESRWNPRVKSGSCIGFFQLKRGNGMGGRHTVEQLMDLDVNVSIMMASTSFKKWTIWAKNNPNKTAGEMSFQFASKVERCASQHRQPRRTTADRWYKNLKSS